MAKWHQAVSASAAKHARDRTETVVDHATRVAKPAPRWCEATRARFWPLGQGWWSSPRGARISHVASAKTPLWHLPDHVVPHLALELELGAPHPRSWSEKLLPRVQSSGAQQGQIYGPNRRSLKATTTVRAARERRHRSAHEFRSGMSQRLWCSVQPNGGGLAFVIGDIRTPWEPSHLLGKPYMARTERPPPRALITTLDRRLATEWGGRLNRQM